MTDWTTCRVVRDGKGRLRTDDGPIRGLVGDGLVSAESAAAYEHMLGPLVPVLDADGQPVVRTVGDLGNVHLGRRIKYEGPGGYGREGIYQGTTADYPERDRCNMHVGGGYEAGVPLDTHCEVLA